MVYHKKNINFHDECYVSSLYDTGNLVLAVSIIFWGILTKLVCNSDLCLVEIAFTNSRGDLNNTQTMSYLSNIKNCRL